MKLDKSDRDALFETLTMLGAKSDGADLECLAFSRPSEDGNKAVHLKANEQLLEVLLREEPGSCIHVTGEMRALADPFHRRLCSELVRRANSRFTVIYNIPGEYCQTPDGVGRWNAMSWQSKTWRERLSAIDLIGAEIVDVRAYNTLDEIQYSVFGNRFVLLQEKHPEERPDGVPTAKRVWLLRSSSLNQHLTEKANEIARAAVDLPESLFRRFSAQVNGITSRAILINILRKGGQALADEALDWRIRGLDEDAAGSLDTLKAVGFVASEPGNRVCLTQAGRDYLKSVCPCQIVAQA